MAVFIWRLTGLAFQAARRWPAQTILLIVVLGVVGGLNAFAEATGLGAVMIAAVAIPVGLIVIVLLVAFAWSMSPWAQARAREAESDRRAQREQYLDMMSRWEAGTIEPDEVIAQVRSRRASKIITRWDFRALREAEEALASGTSVERTGRVARYKEWYEPKGQQPTSWNEEAGRMDYAQVASPPD